MVEFGEPSTDRIIPHFQNLADAMHKHGAKIMIQITHMGRRSRWDGYHWPTLMSPSGIREPVHRATCKTIEVEEIWRVIGNYAQAARRASEGGLDGVELSAVHQHMIDQFWSPRVNKRTDEWGGSFEGRMKFGLEVLRRCAPRSARTSASACASAATSSTRTACPTRT